VRQFGAVAAASRLIAFKLFTCVPAGLEIRDSKFRVVLGEMRETGAT
jgi:hypothetical protein